jgi:hypothetical protein
MKFADFGSAFSRRVMVVAGLLAVVLAGARVVGAQEAAAPGPDQFMFQAPAALIQWQVKADKATDFESAWVALRTKLSASATPEHKAIGDSLKMFKSEAAPVDAPGAGPIVTYYFLIEPASTTSYDPSKLLYETGELFARAEADLIFNKLAESLAGIGTHSLRPVQ